MNNNHKNNPLNTITGANLGYVLEQYDIYKENPAEVEESFKKLFNAWGSTINQSHETSIHTNLDSKDVFNKISKLVSAIQYADNIRKYGHLEADLYPLYKPKKHQLLDMSTYDLTPSDLEEIPSSFFINDNGQSMNGLEAIEFLKQQYTSTIGFEIDHISPDEKEWLRNKIQTELNKVYSVSEKENIFKELTEAESFEQFLGKMFVGQKRFSIEGLESLVPLINEIVALSADKKFNDVIISMAHRGRLNVLTHVLEKPYEAMLSEFKHSEWINEDTTLDVKNGSTGDVKYHLGAVKDKSIGDRKIRVSLGNNPSHLEFVGTVLEGYTRALQDQRTEKGYPTQNYDKAIPVLIHGDAAITGQGIVTETLNYAQTEAYGTGGTIHVIANNHIGFTAERKESRSTLYSSDIVKGFDIPIIHVNADDPEACLTVAKLAFEYRQKFHKDILIDLSGYRRLGHNEMDEPRMTNPVTYASVDEHPTVTAIYKQKLLNESTVSEQSLNEIVSDIESKLQHAHKGLSQNTTEIQPLTDRVSAFGSNLPVIDTTVDRHTLININDELLKSPAEGFNISRKLNRVLNRRSDAIKNHKKIDWGHAEALAFGSILKDGTPIRLTGEDSERGTFSHRNIVLSDEKTGEKISPMHLVSNVNASFSTYNSTLSENAILGFEYGYNVASPETLVLWEAQFGDFANGAQVIIDQFISSGREKWGQKSGLVMLLPHGYEGQGPEHSNARPERFLQLAAENNWTIANYSTSGNYFHALRRQAAILNTKEMRPLIIMTPKSLLRNASSSVFIEELSNGAYQEVIEQPGLGTKPEQVERLIFTTGRLSIDLSDHIEENVEKFNWLNIVRVEELYPFPEKNINEIIKKYKNIKEIMWVQEEPRNMGAWNYIAPKLQKTAPKNMTVSYNGRPDMSSPSEGDPRVHKQEQDRIITKALTKAKVKNPIEV